MQGGWHNDRGKEERVNERSGRRRMRTVGRCNKGKEVAKVEDIAAFCASTGTSYASGHIEIGRFWMSKNPDITQ